MTIEEDFNDMSSFKSQPECDGLTILEQAKRKIENGKHFILHGPPGTGKTRSIYEVLNQESIVDNLGILKSVQFHPQYSYQDFVEGYTARDGQFNYKAGVFLQFVKDANEPENTNKINIFFVDEINRADITSVFGELMGLLDNVAEREISLPISRDVISFKNKILIIGTMNSADKSIAILDYALRRRFDFIFVPPDYSGMAQWLDAHGFDFADFTIAQYVDFAETLNSRIISSIFLGKNMTLGQSFFVPIKDQSKGIALSDISEMLTDKIIPQIEAYLGRGNASEIAAILSPEIAEKIEEGINVTQTDALNLINSMAPSHD